MRKFLHIIEYSGSSPKYKIPDKRSFEYDINYNGNLVRTFVDSNRDRIKESLDYIYDESKVAEKTIPLKDVIIYDNIDYKEDQELAYVFECPICLNITITSDAGLDFCPHCENTKFAPNVIAILNIEQMDNIAIENKDVSGLIIVKDDKVIYREDKKNNE